MQDSSAALAQAAHENALDVEIVPFALGSHAGTVELSGVVGYDDFDAGVRSRFGNSDVHWPARMVPFDSWVAEVNLDRLDIVKMDVEGAELDVLEGMHESLIRLRPRRLIVELKDAVLQRAGVDAEMIDRFLDRAGYRRAGLSYHRNEVYSCDRSQSR